MALVRHVSSTGTSAAARRLLLLAGNARTLDEAIQRIVSRLLDGIDCPPTNLLSIAPRLNVTSIHEEDIPGSGGLRKVGKGFHVVYATGLPSGRRNFTIAHELGHAILESTGPRAPRAGKEVERLCNSIAAELLLPAGPFRAYIGISPAPQRIIEVAHVFCVSLESAARRCAEILGVTTFLVEEESLVWCYGARPFKEIPEEFASPVSHAVAGDSVSIAVPLLERGGGSRTWSLTGQPLSGARALFVAKSTGSLVTF